MTRGQVQLVGGPNDGKTVQYVGPTYYEPILGPRQFFPADPNKLPPPGSTRIATLVYDLREWRDGRTSSPRYVLRDQAKALGASP